MKVTLWGYYGLNYGDDIMMEVLLDFLLANKIEVDLVDLFSGKLENRYKEIYPEVKFIPFYKFSQFEKLSKIKYFSNSTLNLWGGGTVFTDEDGDGNFKVFTMISLAGGKIGYIGVGIGNLLKSSRKLKTKILLSKSSFTVFRDPTSLKRAKEMTRNRDFYLVEDLSYLYFQNKDSQKNNSKEKYILITWRNLKNYITQDKEIKLMHEVIDATEVIMKRDGINKVVLAALDTRHDTESCNVLSSILEKRNIEFIYNTNSSISNISNLIANADFHFSGRLHGSVASEYYRVPTLSLSYSPKIESFYKSIEASNYIDIYNSSMVIDDIKEFVAKGSNKYDFSKKIIDSKRNIDYLKGFLGLNH